MKNIFLLLLLFAGMVSAQNVTIPDANFKAKLLTSSTTNFIAYGNGGYIKIDDNNDGEIQLSEAQAIDSLEVNNANILDLTGIADFSNLKKLYCINNQLNDLDITNLTQLKKLDCSGNMLGDINLNGLTNLQTLDCYENQITALDLSGLVNLEYLGCGDNLLTALDVSPCPNLIQLHCGLNQIPTLDLSGLVNLKWISCPDNQLTTLNLSGSPAVEELDCELNQLAALNLTDQINLRSLNCNTNLLTTLDLRAQSLPLILYCRLMETLDSLFMKNGAGVGSQTYFDGNPNLSFICVDAAEEAIINLLVTTYGYTNCVVNSYCTMVPGGNYNTISGNVTFDADNNGCDQTDFRVPYFRFMIDLNGITTNASVYTGSSGNYNLYTANEGVYSLIPNIENASFFQVNPEPGIAILDVIDNGSTNLDFCITPNGFHPDVEVVISPVFFARPGFDATYQITYRNKGNQTFSEGLVGLQYNDAVLDFVTASQAAFSQAVGNINWQYTNLLPFESRTFTVVLNVNSPMETPPVNIGDELNFVVSTFPFEVDENPQDNTFEYIQTVVGSYDPNDITCLEGDVVAPSEIGNYLHYAINFENTGTFPAENVVVKTEVDAAQFDINSLQLMNASNEVDARITGNKVEFIFKNIQLPIGGHGHILLKIKTRNTLVANDAVAKRADIFFDYNAPVDTGFANTVFQTLSNTSFEIDNSVMVAPNPASNEVNVKADNNIKSIQLYDVQGRIIVSSLIDDLESKLDISSYSKGIYFIKITTSKGIQVQKLLKD